MSAHSSDQRATTTTDTPASTNTWRKAKSPGIARFKENRLAIIGLVIFGALLFCALVAPFLTPYDPVTMDTADRFQPPSRAHLLGTDQFGRDLLTRILYGARISLSVGIVSVGIAGVAGTALGITAGYFRGALDLTISRIMDVLFAFPVILLAIAIMAVLGQSLVNVMLAVAIVSTPIFARVVRAATLSVGVQPYLEAAHAMGMTHRRIMLRHVLPNCLGPLIVQIAVALAWAIMAESALSFLGLGVRPPTPSWGLTLEEGRDVLRYAPWQAISAGVAIMLAVFSLNVIGDGLRDALDPQNRTPA